ncbi:hypothetical protein [Sediminibacterium soli]|uniref:hypothetical protein n=1 Tax=Sediminibacterium soli TaxID=2698829 RepID=UPI00137B58B9|nr:hypothetical protein [Sediminibacterium soli]NCI45441.1 hypothetical protein [Sediminibacterium soli]
MPAPSTIRKIITGLLLAVFAFGITPKRTLHNLIATHKDGKLAVSDKSCDDTVLSKAAFNCQCDNLVVESPFVPEVAGIAVVAPEHPAVYRPAFSQDVHIAPYFSFSLRGPPALA